MQLQVESKAVLAMNQQYTGRKGSCNPSLLFNDERYGFTRSSWALVAIISLFSDIENNKFMEMRLIYLILLLCQNFFISILSFKSNSLIQTRMICMQVSSWYDWAMIVFSKEMSWAHNYKNTAHNDQYFATALTCLSLCFKDLSK